MFYPLTLLFAAAFCSSLNVPATAQESAPASAVETVQGAGQTPAPSEASPQSAQKPDSAEQGTPDEKKVDDKQKEKKKKKPPRGAPVVAPLPVSSPAIGNGVIPVLAYIFPLSEKDKLSPPSVIGAAGIITDNGTRGFAVGAELYFKENTYKATAGYAHGNLNYDIYGLGILAGEGAKLPLKQSGHGFFGEFLRRLWWDFFLGPRFWDGNSFLTLGVSNVGSIQLPPDLGLHTTLRAFGFRLQRDKRPNQFYPTKGTLTDFTTDFYAQALGSKYTFQAYRVTFNKYGSLTKNQVLAFGSYFCATGGQPPFYGNCIYGAQNQLRGYTAGRYFDRYLLDSQLEYRLVLPKRFGLVAFGGLGGVIPGGDRLLRNAFFLPSGGGGLRFELSKKYHVNLRADIAQGKDGHVFSMGVGEAF